MALTQRASGPTIYTVDGWVPEPLRDQMRQWTPRTGISWAVVSFLRDLHRKGVHLPPDGVREILEAIWRTVTMESELALTVIRTPASRFKIGASLIENYGVVGRRLVTDAAVAFIADDMYDGSTDVSTWDYHGLGTGSTAESAAHTALVTELTTEYTGDTRASGTPSNPSAPVYRTVATNTLDSGTPALREHGVFTAASGGTMLDRTLFASITLDGTAGDSLQSTYSLTLTSGG